MVSFTLTAMLLQIKDFLRATTLSAISKILVVVYFMKIVDADKFIPPVCLSIGNFMLIFLGRFCG